MHLWPYLCNLHQGSWVGDILHCSPLFPTPMRTVPCKDLLSRCLFRARIELGIASLHLSVCHRYPYQPSYHSGPASQVKPICKGDCRQDHETLCLFITRQRAGCFQLLSLCRQRQIWKEQKVVLLVSTMPEGKISNHGRGPIKQSLIYRQGFQSHSCHYQCLLHLTVLQKNKRDNANRFISWCFLTKDIVL